MDLTLLDTDTLTEIFKARNVAVTNHAAAYLKVHGQFAISAMTLFEVVRGLRIKGATTQLQDFGALCEGTIIFPVSGDVLDRAADLWAAGRRGGQPSHDADLIIAATAMEQGRTLTTGNTAHFQWITGLKLEDWRME